MITVNGERCSFSTGKQIAIEKWDKTKQQVKGKDQETQNLNNYLKAIKAKLYQKEAELLERGFIITAQILYDAYFDKVESLKERSLFEVFEEHLYTEVITGVLRHAIASLTPQPVPQGPKVLLTTVPQEQHSLGLLMVEALLALEGCTCVSLGTQTPLTDIAQAALAHRADVVALSFSNLHKAAVVQTSLREWAYARAYESSAQRQAALQPFVDHYNWLRPHSALNRQPPMSRILAMNNLLRLNS